jgi:hypothetical protein
MQTARFLEFGFCRELHEVHLDDGSPTSGLLCSWSEELEMAADMKKGEMGEWSIDLWSLSFVLDMITATVSIWFNERPRSF